MPGAGGKENGESCLVGSVSVGQDERAPEADGQRPGTTRVQSAGEYTLRHGHDGAVCVMCILSRLKKKREKDKHVESMYFIELTYLKYGNFNVKILSLHCFQTESLESFGKLGLTEHFRLGWAGQDSGTMAPSSRLLSAAVPFRAVPK